MTTEPSEPRIPVQDRKLRQQLQAARFRLLTDPDRGALSCRAVNESFDRIAKTFQGATGDEHVPTLVEQAVRAEICAKDVPTG